MQGEIFLKAPASVVGDGATVTLPNLPDREIHHEAELGVIIGRRTTADEVPDPQALSVRLWCNGELRQDDTTRKMVYSVAELLAYASAVMPLYPGDVVASGTPSGVGPIRPGEHVEMEVAVGGIGRLAVDIAAPTPGSPLAEVGLGGRPKSRPH